MYTHHRFDHEFPPETELRCAYAVCSVPRSGSSLLCERLMLTGVAGAPTEYLDAEQLEQFSRVWGAEGLDDYLALLVEKKTSPNGVFGLKVHYDQMRAALGDRDLCSVFPGLRLVYMRRADHLAQAVSYAMAVQSNRWASTHRATGRVTYRREQITDMLEQIHCDEERWEAWFAEHDVTPLRIEYSDLVEDQEGTVARVLGFLDVAPEDARTTSEPTLERQAGVRSRLWQARYRAEGLPRLSRLHRQPDGTPGCCRR